MSEHAAARAQKAKTSQPGTTDDGDWLCRGTKQIEPAALAEWQPDRAPDPSAGSRIEHDFSRLKLHARDTLPLLRAPPMVQQFPANGTTAFAPDVASVEQVAAPTPAEPATEPNGPEPEATPTPAEPAIESETADETAVPGLLVEDSATDLALGQMKKSAFLAELRTAVCAATEPVLAGTGRTTEGCPYLDYWFDYYAQRDAAHVERALHRYVPEASRATTARGYIPIVAERVRQGAERWVRTGEVSGVPEGVPISLPEETPAQSGEGATASTGPAMLKARDGGARAARNPQVILTQLGDGHPLDSGVRSHMESAFGLSFSHVRVHTDTTAAQSSDRLNARAFTVGEHVAFGSGEYQPGTLLGDALVAHELAHVVQQSGASSSPTLMHKETTAYNSLEEDAETSAVGAMVALWGGIEDISTEIAQNAMPRIKSGLSLQRCTKSSSGPIGAKRLAQARRNFRSENSHLTRAQQAKIDSALQAVASDNLNLWITFYDYYSNQEIEEASSRDMAKWRTGQLAETDPNSDTLLNPTVFDPNFPDNRLGALLIHEFTHTRHESNPMGTRDYQEGDSYAMEYFFAERANDATRRKQILDLMNNPTKLTMQVGVPLLKTRFKVSYATMVGLYEIIDTGRSTRSGTPFTTPTPLTSDQARALATELVSRRPDSHSSRLKAITSWVEANLRSFTLPIR